MPYTDEEWEEIGRTWLRAASQGDLTRPNATQFVRWLKQESYIKDYVCVSNHQLPDTDGKFDPDEERIYYRQSVWDAAERGATRAIWTIWHEASHAIQKHQEVRFRSNVSHKSSASASAGKDEFEANRLTACLVAPFDKSNFHPNTTADDLCRRFDLGREAAERRLKEFARMYRRKNSLPRELPPGVVDFLKRQKGKGYPVQSIGDITGMLPKMQSQYEGDACPCCGEFKLVRSGLSRKCTNKNCRARLGDD